MAVSPGPLRVGGPGTVLIPPLDKCTPWEHNAAPLNPLRIRYFYTSCHTKRAVAFAVWLHTTVLLPVPHRQIVLTIPKMLRIYFRYDRRLLGDPCRVAAGVSVFHALPTMSLAPMDEIFRHRVFKMLMKKGLLTAERVKLMASWEHSGFNIDASVRIGAADATGRENLARYLIRAPFSGERISYNVAEGTVIYQTRRSTGVGENEVLFDPLDFLAAVTSHIPNRGEHLVRYSSHYSSVQRSRRRRQQLEKQPLGSIPIPLSDDIAAAKSARGNWARFIKKVFEVDP